MAKPSTKKLTGEEIVASIKDKKQEIKQAQKEENKMKNPNTTIRTVLTVVITLVAVASLVGMFYLGTQFQDSINHNTASQVKELASTITTSKQ